jgi:hypothetical protein
LGNLAAECQVQSIVDDDGTLVNSLQKLDDVVKALFLEPNLFCLLVHVLLVNK